MYLKMCALLYYLCLQTFLPCSLLPLVCIVLSHPESCGIIPQRELLRAGVRAAGWSCEGRVAQAVGVRFADGQLSVSIVRAYFEIHHRCDLMFIVAGLADEFSHH